MVEHTLVALQVTNTNQPHHNIFFSGLVEREMGVTAVLGEAFSRKDVSGNGQQRRNWGRVYIVYQPPP